MEVACLYYSMPLTYSYSFFNSFRFNELWFISAFSFSRPFVAPAPNSSANLVALGSASSGECLLVFGRLDFYIGLLALAYITSSSGSPPVKPPPGPFGAEGLTICLLMVPWSGLAHRTSTSLGSISLEILPSCPTPSLRSSSTRWAPGANTALNCCASSTRSSPLISPAPPIRNSSYASPTPWSTDSIAFPTSANSNSGPLRKSSPSCFGCAENSFDSRVFVL